MTPKAIAENSRNVEEQQYRRFRRLPTSTASPTRPRIKETDHLDDPTPAGPPHAPAPSLWLVGPKPENASRTHRRQKSKQSIAGMPRTMTDADGGVGGSGKSCPEHPSRAVQRQLAGGTTWSGKPVHNVLLWARRVLLTVFEGEQSIPRDTAIAVERRRDHHGSADALIT